MTRPFGLPSGVVRFTGATLFLATLATALACGDSAPPRSAAQPSAAAATPTPAATADACRLLSTADVAAAVGNPVLDGTPDAGPEVCKWDTENPDHVSVLLIARLKGSAREQALCAEVRRVASAGKGLSGLGEAATWKFSRVGTMFNSGDLEVCDAKGYLSLGLNGQQDEAALQQAASTLARAIVSRW
jgi:hypothetical protein